MSSDIDVAQFVGRWVIAQGEGSVLDSGRLVALRNVSITLADDPADRLESDEVLTLDEILATTPGPDPHGGIDLTDDEFATYLAAARG